MEGLRLSFERSLETRFEETTRNSTQVFSAELAGLAHELFLELDRRRVNRPSHDDLFMNIGQMRLEVISGVRERLAAMLAPGAFLTTLTRNRGESYVSGGLFGGALLFIVGLAVSTTTSVAFVDITGGILTLLGVGLSAVSAMALMLNRSRVVAQFRQGMEAARHSLAVDLEKGLDEQVASLYREIEGCFSDYRAYVEGQAEALEPLLSANERLHARLKALSEAFGRDLCNQHDLP